MPSWAKNYQRRRPRHPSPPDVGHDSATARKVPHFPAESCPHRSGTLPHFKRNQCRTLRPESALSRLGSFHPSQKLLLYASCEPIQPRYPERWRPAISVITAATWSSSAPLLFGDFL